MTFRGDYSPWNSCLWFFERFEPPLFPQLQRLPLANASDAGHEVLLVQVDRST
jgi:hypothetical protein